MYTLILNGSPRKSGDTVKLLDMLTPHIKGECKIINVFFENISPCTDCRICSTSGFCALNDNMRKFYGDLITADNVIIASPLHYSMLSASIMAFASRLQYFYVLKNIKKIPHSKMKEKHGFLILTGGGATKDFYPAEKITKLIFRELNASLDKILKYTNTDSFPLKDFDTFPESKKLCIISEIKSLADKINGKNDN